jgi:hypothetical protein
MSCMTVIKSFVNRKKVMRSSNFFLMCIFHISYLNIHLINLIHLNIGAVVGERKNYKRITLDEQKNHII